MAGIILPSYLSRPPSSPTVVRSSLTNQLSAVFVAGGSGLIDVVSGATPTSNGGSSRFGQSGVLQTYNGSVNTQFGGNPRYWLTSAMTIVVIFDLDALANYNCLLSCSSTSSTNGWELRLGFGPTDSRVIATRAGSSFNQYAASASNLLSAGSKNNFVAVTYPNGLTTDITTPPTFDVNGTSFSGTLLTGNPSVASGVPNAPLYVGNRTDGVTPFSGGILFAGLWNRQLSFSELESIRANPWQVFAPPARKYWIAEATTGVVALTGVSASFTQTNVTPNISVGLTGVSAAFAQGTLTASTGTTVALTGVSANFSQGTLVPSLAKALAGVSGTFAQGALTPASSVGLSGVSATFAQGTLVPNPGATLSGVSAAFALGTLTPSGGVTANLTGVAASFALGTLTPVITPGLTAVSATFSQGTIVPAFAKALTGVSGTFAQGTVGPAATRALTGVAGTFSLGTLTPSSSGGSVTVALTGVSGVFSQGLLSPPVVVTPASLEPPPDSRTQFADVPWQQWFWKVWKAIKALQATVASALPTGGTVGQVLTKNSSTDGDASWQNSTGGGDVPQLKARAYVVVTNPNTVGTALTLTNNTNVGSSSITAQGRYRFTFTSAIPANCVLYTAFGRFPTATDEAVPLFGVDRRSGQGLTTTAIDITVCVENATSPAFDPVWFYFEVRDPAVLA